MLNIYLSIYLYLINVIKNGFTTGLGGGYNVLLLYRIKWINTKYSLCTNIVTLSHWLGGGYNVLLLYRIKWINTKYSLCTNIVTRNGAIIKTNKLLLSLSSPLLRNLLNGDVSSSDRIHLPDVSGTGLIHLINVIKNSFTTGLGGGYNVHLLYIIKWINTKYSLCTNIVTLAWRRI